MLIGMTHDTAYFLGFTVHDPKLLEVSPMRKIHIIVRSKEDIQHHVFSKCGKSVIGHVRFFIHHRPEISNDVKSRVAANWMYQYGVINNLHDYNWRFRVGIHNYFVTEDFNVIKIQYLKNRKGMETNDRNCKSDEHNQTSER